MCGVPVGTLTLACLIRGLQTLGYSCGVVSPLCLRRDASACRVRDVLAGVSGGYKPSGDVWSTCRHSHACLPNPRVTNPRLLVWSGFTTLPDGVRGCLRCGMSSLACPGVTNPREMCGVPVGTLTLACLIRGLQTLGYSCGVVSPLCLPAGCVSAGLSEGRRDSRLLVWSGFAALPPAGVFACGAGCPCRRGASALRVRGGGMGFVPVGGDIFRGRFRIVAPNG